MYEPQASPGTAPDEPAFAEDGTDLTLIRWALDLTPAERLRAFETFMADIVIMANAAAERA